eukprot:766522-Hanusia_phi.AAC.1
MPILRKVYFVPLRACYQEQGISCVFAPLRREALSATTNSTAASIRLPHHGTGSMLNDLHNNGERLTLKWQNRIEPESQAENMKPRSAVHSCYCSNPRRFSPAPISFPSPRYLRPSHRELQAVAGCRLLPSGETEWLLIKRGKVGGPDCTRACNPSGPAAFLRGVEFAGRVGGAGRGYASGSETRGTCHVGTEKGHLSSSPAV